MKKIVFLAAAVLVFGAAAHGQPTADTEEEPHFGRMQSIMAQIQQIEDAERRAELLEQHLDEMHAVLARIHSDLGRLMEGFEEQRSERRRLHQHRPGPTRR